MDTLQFMNMEPSELAQWAVFLDIVSNLRHLVLNEHTQKWLWTTHTYSTKSKLYLSSLILSSFHPPLSLLLSLSPATPAPQH